MAAADFNDEFYQRLEKSTKKHTPAITTWERYRKKNCLPKSTKIFICKEFYYFKKALFQRGWHENTDYDSPIFNLKFTVKSKDVYKNQKGTCQNMKGCEWDLQDFQMVNHFYKHSFITSKVGLCQSLKNLHFWSSQVAMDDFFPKCYVLHRNDRIVIDSKNDFEDKMQE